MNFNQLKEEIIEELYDIYPTTSADEFYLNYLLSFAKVLKREDLEIFYKDVLGASSYPYVSYGFEAKLRRLASKLANFIEQYKKTS
jgi:Fe-S oxidoreductase